MTVFGRCQNLISELKGALCCPITNIENPIKMLSAYAQRLMLVFVKTKTKAF